MKVSHFFLSGVFSVLVGSVNAQTVIWSDINYPDVPQVISTSDDPVGTISGQFDVSPMGAATYTIPLEVPKGLSGMEPQISITYNSQMGNGIVGYGCSISGISSITRNSRDIYHDGAAHGIGYTCDDAFSLDGQRLMITQPRNGSDSVVYCLERSPFTRIVLHGANSNQSWFTVESPDGMIYNYSARQLGYGAGFGAVNAWYLSWVENTIGNRINYSYDIQGSGIYLNSINYGGNSVLFIYQSRPDTVMTPMPGTRMVVDRRLNEIRMRTATENSSRLWRTYNFNYDDTGDLSVCRQSRLISVTLTNHSGESLRPTVLHWENIPQYTCEKVVPTFSPSIYTYGAQRSNMSFFSADLNGDGLSDLVEMGRTNIAPHNADYNFIRVYQASKSNGQISFSQDYELPLGQQVDYEEFWIDRYTSPTAFDVDGDGVCELAIPFFKYNEDVHCFGLRVYKNGIFANGCQNPDIHVSSMNNIVWSIADFNNDGKAESVVIERATESNNLYYGSIIGNHQEEDAFCKPFRFSLPNIPFHVFTTDMNNDGMTDVVVFYQNGYRIFWNDGTWLNNTNSSTPVIPSSYSTYNLAVIPSRVWQGDFNGDGVTDFLISAENHGNLYFALGDGAGNLSLSVAAVTCVFEQTAYDNDDDSFGCYVTDLDGDGKTDVIVNKGMYNSNTSFLKGYTYWFFSDGQHLIQKKLATTNNNEDSRSRFFVTGDFDGDGLSELASLSYDCYSGENANENPVFRIYRNGDYQCSTGKVTAVVDGMENTTQVSYKSMADNTVYSKGNDSSLSYPVVTLTPALTVVSSVSNSNGSAGSQISNYTYEGLKVHTEGRGLLGFVATTVDNQTTGLSVNRRITEWDTDSYLPVQTVETQNIGNQTATTTTTYQVVPVSGKPVDFRYPRYVRNFDFDGNYIEDEYHYSVLYNGALETHWHTANRYAETTYNLGLHQVGRQYLPDTVSVWRHYWGGGPDNIRATAYQYDSKGQVSSKTTDAGTPKAVTTAYTYDQQGNVLSSTTSGTGVETITKTFQYESTHRYVKKTVERGYIETQYTYDYWGNVTTKKDKTRPGYPLTTAYEYDGWGNVLGEQTTDGCYTSYERGWGNSTDNKFFVVKQGTAQPWVLTWYDSTGRETYSETAGPMGLSYANQMTYNSKGLLSQKTSTTKKQGSQSVSTILESYIYDARDRVLTHVYDGTTTSYTYGQNQQSVTKGGRTVTTTYDSMGKVLTVSDPSGTVSYQYASNWKPLTVTAHGSTVTMEYDVAGNRTKLIDPDAGTMTYTYDAYGRVLTQTDARGKTTVNTYDSKGRLSQSTTDGISTAYTYGETASDRGMLLQTAREGNTISYTYDQYGRVATEKRKTANLPEKTFSYTYGVGGLLISKTYPENLTVNYTYDSYGHKTAMTIGGQPVWTLYSMTPTSISSLNGSLLKTVITTDARGRVVSKDFKAFPSDTSIRSMLFSYDDETDNLVSRTGMFPQTEHFSYDSLDRLTGIQYGSGATHEICYNFNGNISYQSGIGRYSYEDSKPHAVVSIENTDGSIPLQRQNTTYNAFGKINCIENDGGNRVLFTYGPDNERCMTRLYSQDNQLLRTVYYMGDYELIQKNNVTRHLYYLDGGALYVKETGKADSLYFMFTDHLGSIVDIANSANRRVFSATYDAWGKQTVTNDEIGFHRGYTGHEMLPDFGLINMNGRLYDPVIGRFLSTDNFVQEPWNSQNFNRYSYCLNNPLKYTDPSGEFAWMPILIGAAMGGALSGLTYASTTLLPNSSWKTSDFFKSVGIGALSGALSATFSQLGSFAPSGSFFSKFSSSIGYKLLSQTTNSIITNTIYNNNISLLQMPGIVFGAAFNSVLPDYEAVDGGWFKNIANEMGHNVITGLSSGIVHGVVQAPIDGNADIVPQSIISGALSAFSRTALMDILMGAPFKNDLFEAKGGLFRQGGLFGLIAKIPKDMYGGGLTLGRNMWVNPDYPSKKGNLQLLCHEYCHFVQLHDNYGWTGFYSRYLYEVVKFFFVEGKQYGAKGTLDYEADQYYNYF